MVKINNSARACVVYEGKLLLVSNDGGYWHLPGGHLEPGESLHLCATREVYEETGYKIIPQDIIYVFEFYDRTIDSHKVECVFRAIVEAHPNNNHWEDLGRDKSVTMMRWFSLEEIKSRNDVYPECLKDAKWLSQPGDKVYCGYKKSK